VTAQIRPRNPSRGVTWLNYVARALIVAPSLEDFTLGYANLENYRTRVLRISRPCRIGLRGLQKQLPRFEWYRAPVSASLSARTWACALFVAFGFQCRGGDGLERCGELAAPFPASSSWFG